jgi:uncharacterized protein
MRRDEPPTTRGSSRAPRASLGGRFDAFELARQRGTVSGEVAAAELPRVADCLASHGGRVAYAISGTTDAADRPALEVSVNGALSLTCQRCLQPMSWSVAQRTTVVLAHDERELARLDESDEHEVLLADAPLDSLLLIEDELLLTMPYAPRHPQGEGAACAPAIDGEPDPARPASPFGALAGLKPRPAVGKRPKR